MDGARLVSIYERGGRDALGDRSGLIDMPFPFLLLRTSYPGYVSFFSGSDAERAFMAEERALSLRHTLTPLDPAGSHRAGRGELTAS